MCDVGTRKNAGTSKTLTPRVCMNQKTTPRARQKDGAPKQSELPNFPAAAGPPMDEHSAWVRLPRAGCSLRGLSRSFLYRLCEAGTLTSILIPGPPVVSKAGTMRPRKSKRGVRLLLLSSLDDFLAAQLREQGGGEVK